MSSDVWSIVLGVVANFIYAAIVSWWRKGQQTGRLSAVSPLKPQTSPAVPAPTPPPPPDDRRLRNTLAVYDAVQRFIYHAVTFAALYLATSMPPLFKALFSKTPILLSDARFVGELLPDIAVGKQNFQLAFFVAAALLYVPVLALAEFLASLVAPAIDAFTPVTRAVLSGTAMLFFLSLCAPIAATSVWLFFERSYLQSLSTVGMVFMVAALVFMTQGGDARR